MSAKTLDDLEKMSKFEGYYDDAKEEFEALRSKLKPNLSKDLDFNKESICEILNNDIVTAYYYQRGAVQNTLRTDKQVKAAFDLLADTSRYQQLLKSTDKDKAKK